MIRRQGVGSGTARVAGVRRLSPAKVTLNLVSMLSLATLPVYYPKWDGDHSSTAVSTSAHARDLTWNNAAVDASLGFPLLTATSDCLIEVPGDVDTSGFVTAGDVIRLVNYVFKGGTVPQPCVANGDVNCSGTVTSADVITLIGHVFKGRWMCDICNHSPLSLTCQ